MRAHGQSEPAKKNVCSQADRLLTTLHTTSVVSCQLSVSFTFLEQIIIFVKSADASLSQFIVMVMAGTWLEADRTRQCGKTYLTRSQVELCIFWTDHSPCRTDVLGDWVGGLK